MAVAAMVARQMREARMNANTPDETWTEEQIEMFELQKRSKATFKSEIVLQQLEQNKPPEKEPKYYNIPLLISLSVLVLGLVIIGYSVYESSRTSIIIKLIGPILVFIGMFCVLTRIAFSYTPSFIADPENYFNTKKKSARKKGNVKIQNISGRLVADPN